jgi:hypothetical protein
MTSVQQVRFYSFSAKLLPSSKPDSRLTELLRLAMVNLILDTKPQELLCSTWRVLQDFTAAER